MLVTIVRLFSVLTAMAASSAFGQEGVIDLRGRLSDIERSLLPLVDAAEYWTPQQREEAAFQYRSELNVLLGAEISEAEVSQEEDYRLIIQLADGLLTVTSKMSDELRFAEWKRFQSEWATIALRDMNRPRVQRYRSDHEEEVWVARQGIGGEVVHDVWFPAEHGGKTPDEADWERRQQFPLADLDYRRWQRTTYHRWKQSTLSSPVERLVLDISDYTPTRDRGAWTAALLSHFSDRAERWAQAKQGEASVAHWPQYSTRASLLALRDDAMDQLDKIRSSKRNHHERRLAQLSDQLAIAESQDLKSLQQIRTRLQAEATGIQEMIETAQETQPAGDLSINLRDFMKREAIYGNGRKVSIVEMAPTSSPPPARDARREQRRRGGGAGGVQENQSAQDASIVDMDRSGFPPWLIIELDSGCKYRLLPLVPIGPETNRLAYTHPETRVSRTLDARVAVPLQGFPGIRGILHSPYGRDEDITRTEFSPCFVIKEINGITVGVIVHQVGPGCGAENLLEPIAALLAVDE